MISAIKLSILGIPFTLVDITFLNSAGSLFDLITIKDIFNVFTIKPFIQFFCLMSILTIMFIGNKNKENLKIKSKERLTITPILILLLIILYIPNIFATIVDKNISRVSTEGYYAAMGLPAGLYGKMLNERVSKPLNYNEKEIKKELDTITQKENDLANWGTPNIIVVLSEAFWNIEKIDEVSFKQDIMHSYNQLKINNVKKEINMVSPTYAGMTANTEFEFLTGMSLNYFDETFIAFQQLFNNKTKENYPSIVKTLKDNNYLTIAYSPMDNGNIYNLNKIYKYLGFDETYFFDDVYKDSASIKGLNISDEHLFDTVLTKLETLETPYFCYIKTIQNHMPYNSNKYTKDELIIEIDNSTLSYEENFRLQLYAQGLYDANIQLDRLYKTIQEYDEPTIIIYFGDHLPSLQTSNSKDIIENLSFTNTGNCLQDNFNKHNVEAIILSNYEITIENEINYMSFYNLSPYIIKHLNINKKSAYYNYFSLLYSKMENYTGGKSNFLIDKTGRLYDINNLPLELQNDYNYREKIQYYFLTKED